MDSNPNPKPNPKSDLTVLQALVDNPPVRTLKKHLTSNPHLKPLLPQSLKLAKNPASLVLEAIGKYYVNGSKVYTSAQQIAARVTSVMLLEAFVMISSDEGVEVGECERNLASKSAVAWRNRMEKEGGIGNVEEIDARGLLLLVSGFGVGVTDVGIRELKDLIRRANVKGIAPALRCSVSFISKVPEVIDLMVKDNLVIEAADIAYTFGLQDKCHPETILATYLQNKDNDIENYSPSELLAAKKQLLSNYRSVKKCLESHKIDPSKLLPDINISEKIQHMEHEIAEEKKGKHSPLTPQPTGPKANKREVNRKVPKTGKEVSSKRGHEEKTIQKRKAIEDETLENLKHHEEKRAYFIRENISHDQKPVDDHQYILYPSYRSTQPSNSYFDFDRNLSNNHVTTYSAPSVYSASALPENRTSSVPSGFAGPYGTTGLTSPYGTTGLTSPYGTSGLPGSFGTSGLPGSYGTSGLTGPSGTSAYGSTVIDQLVHKVDSALIEKYSQPSSTSLYSRPSGLASLESYTRLPEYSPSIPTRHTPDLYSFADTIEMESRGSHASRIGTSRSSYLYEQR